MKKRWLSAVLAALLLVSAVGCNKNTTEMEVVKIDPPTVLTHVYKGEDIALPDEEGYNIRDFLGQDGEDLLFWGTYYHMEGDPEKEDYSYEYYPIICRLPGAGGDPVIEKVDWAENIDKIVLTPDGYLAMGYVFDEATMTQSFNLLHHKKDGTTETIEDLSQFFSSGGDYFYLQNFAQDKEGYTYLFADMEIVVLKPDFTKAFSITNDNWVESVDQDASGTVYISYGYYDEAAQRYSQVFAPIDKEAKKIGEPITLPDNIQANSFFFGEGYELFYYNDTGIYGYNTGDADGTLLMHFQNSDITGDLDMAKSLGDGKFLLNYYNRIDWNRKMGIFTKAPDVDLSQIQVLEIVTTSNSYDLPTMVVSYNRSHDDSRIVVTDYSQYATAEDPDGANTKLANDLLNGILEPDMICGYYSDSAYQAVLDNELYVDLNTFLETDTVLPKEDLFGCVLNTFQDDGKIFGLPMAISLKTVIANKNLVGDRDSWTVDELLDTIQNLPDGVEYMSGLSQITVINNLLGTTGYGNFVNLEENTCSFDSPSFIALLEYIATLPKEMSQSDYENQNEDRYGPYKTGKVAAVTTYYNGINSFLRERIYFGADNIAHVGYPTNDGYSGVRLDSYETLFTVMTTSENPAECWTFIRDALIDTNTPDNMLGNGALPMFRSALKPLKEEYKDTTFVVHYDGGMSWGSGYTPDESELKNGEAFTLTDADWDYIENFLDTIGGPLSSSTLPADLSEIIAEEISAFLSGTRSAADCASMLQNRVNLYLAEQG